MGRPPASGEKGQAAVELALVLPLLAVLALVLLQVALVVRDQVVLTHVAREAARELAVNPAPGAPRRAALGAAPLNPDRLVVDASRRGQAGTRARVEVRYRAPTNVPVVGALVGDVSLVATVSMRVES